jgi:hypothetical protein
VNVDCSDYYQIMIKQRNPATIIGTPSHSWQIGDPVFTEDLACTLKGDLDRRAIRTRKQLPSGQLKLVQPQDLVASAGVTPIQVAPLPPPAG